MNQNEWYVIGLSNEGDKVINNYVEVITFRNHHFKDFSNCTLQFTDDLRFALRIKSKELADNLAFVARKALPKLKVQAIYFNDDWWKI